MDNARDLIGEIGANIKTLRLAKGLQQKEVASMTGVSVSQYGRIENGLTKSSIVVLLRMAEALEVSLDMLIYGEKTEIDKEPIVLKDKDLVEKMKQQDRLSDKDKELAHQMLDLLLAKMRFKELMNDL